MITYVSSTNESNSHYMMADIWSFTYDKRISINKLISNISLTALIDDSRPLQALNGICISLMIEHSAVNAAQALLVDRHFARVKHAFKALFLSFCSMTQWYLKELKYTHSLVLSFKTSRTLKENSHFCVDKHCGQRNRRWLTSLLSNSMRNSYLTSFYNCTCSSQAFRTTLATVNFKNCCTLRVSS